jgi:hypothetical protein
VCLCRFNDIFCIQTPKDIMAMFDKDGNGVLDKEEMMEFKKQFKNISTGSGPATPLPGANADPRSGALGKQPEGSAGSAASGCGGPGGFCCCRCGCPKGGRCS